MHRMMTTCLAAGLTLGVALTASSAEPQVSFGEHDVQTVFFISKSSDRNRVDYGVRLDSRCRPRGDEPVYFYWRRFEPGQRRFDNLHVLAQRAYGLESQRVHTRGEGGTWIELRLRALSQRRILILVRPTAEGCVAEARVTISDREARLDHVFVQLGGFMSVDYIRVVGRTLENEVRVVERIEN